MTTKKPAPKKPAKKAARAKASASENAFSFDSLSAPLKEAVLVNLGIYGKVLDEVQANLEQAQENLEKALELSPADQLKDLAARGEQLQEEIKAQYESLNVIPGLDVEDVVEKVRDAVDDVKSRFTAAND
jgi:hypothetical protein